MSTTAITTEAARITRLLDRKLKALRREKIGFVFQSKQPENPDPSGSASCFAS